MNNIKEFAIDRKLGSCPFCNSNDTDASFIVVDNKTRMGFGIIWCNDCKHAFRLSRMKIESDMHEKKIPSDLKF